MNKEQLLGRIGKILLAIWLILCIAMFIYIPGQLSYVHWINLDGYYNLPVKLARIDFVAYIFDLIRAIIGIGIFSIANTSLGLLVLHKLKLDDKRNHSTISNWAFLGSSFLVGHAIFSMIFLALAARFQLTPVNSAVILGVGFLAGVVTLKNFILQPVARGEPVQTSTNNWNRAIRGLLLAILILSLFYSSARLSYDSVALYFSDAKLTAITHRLQYFTDDSFVASIFHSAIQFTVLIQVFDDQAARLFSWVCGLIMIIFSLALGEEIGLKRIGRLFLFLLLITSTAFLDLMGDGKVDLASAAPTIAAVYWLSTEYQRKAPHKSVLFLTGFLASLSMVARPFNVVIMGIFIFLSCIQIAFAHKANKYLDLNRFAVTIVWIGLGGIGLGVYHLWANWIILDNPLAMISNAATVDPAKWQWAFDSEQLLAARLLYPFTVTFFNTAQSLGNISPLFVAFLPVVLVRKYRSKIELTKPAYNLLITAIITLALWVFLFFTVLEIRYVFFLWIILFIPIAQIMAVLLENQGGFFGTILHTTIIGFMLFIGLRVVFIAIDSYSPTDREGNPQCYDSPFCQYLRPINDFAPEGARVLTLGAFRYYLRSDLFACSPTHENYRMLRELSNKNPETFWREVYRQGYQFIAYENDYTTRHLQFGMIPSPENAPQWLTLEPIYGQPGDLEVAYRIHVTNPPINAEVVCKKNDSQIWEVHPVSQP